jgi:excisionase family DNA binding protein
VAENMTTEELAGYLRKTVATIYAMNSKGTGPRRIRIGKHVIYRKADVDAWLDSHAIESEVG